ncbi:hypothetical protein IKJ53_04675 [bacterium]|nr:hypothetical protein [bacterium]
MKRFILLFITIFTFAILPATSNELPIREKFEQSKATYSNKSSVIKFFQDHANYANEKKIKELLNCYAPEFITNDGFDKNIAEKMLTSLWKDKNEIKYQNKVNSISFYGDTALVDVTEHANAKMKNSDKQKGTLKSCSNILYCLKKTNNSWIIVSENVLTEEINITWGDARYVAMFMEAPQQVAANTEYSARLYIAPPTGIVAIGAIRNDKITYPQIDGENVFRKFSPDYTLERLLISNSDNTNEYAFSTVMFSNSHTRNNAITGYAYLIRRVNVVPKNNFIKDIKTKDETIKK